MVKKKYLLTYISIFIFIIWDAVWTYIFNKSSGSFTGVILLFFLIIGLIDNITNKGFFKVLYKKPFIFWFLWMLVAFINTFLSNITPAENKSISILMFLVIPFLIVMSIQLMNLSELKTTINVFIFCLIFKTFISLAFDEFGFGNGGYRFGIKYNSNMIAFCVIILYLLGLIRKSLYDNNKALNIFILILTILLLGMTQSRKSALVFLIIIIGQKFIFTKGNSLKKFFKLSFFLLFFSLVLGITISKTNIGERVIETAVKTQNATSDEERFDGRLVQYIQGYEVFKSSPMLGIGLFNYRYIDRYGLELHSEYLTQFVETGIIGSSLFLLFYGYLFVRLFRVKSNSKFKTVANVLILSLISYFILFFGTWIYNISMFWLIIGIALRVISLEKDNQKIDTKQFKIYN